MRKPYTAVAALFLMIAALSYSCAQNVKTVNVWKDEAYQKKPRKVLVIGMIENRVVRNFFENNLVQRLKEQGVDAVAANKVFPESGSAPDRPAISARVKELGSDSVLVSRVVSKREEASMNQSGAYYTSGFSKKDLFDFTYESTVLMREPGFEYDAEIFSIVSNLYDVQTDKLSWSFLSTVRVEGSKERGIEQYIDKLMGQLKGSRLI